MSGDSYLNALIKVYLGERSSEFALKAALHPREDIDRRRLNQAYFYIGPLAQLNSDDKRAEKHFEAAISFEVFDAIERAAASTYFTSALPS